jgi:hypothetical protein
MVNYLGQNTIPVLHFLEITPIIHQEIRYAQTMHDLPYGKQDCY